MTTVYKLTDANMRTHGGEQWTLNSAKTVSGTGPICGDGWLHYYHDPVLAVMLDTFYSAVSGRRLFQADATGATIDNDGYKGGAAQVTLQTELTIPTVTVEQRARFAILCAKEVYTETTWVAWADSWLNDTDQTSASAGTARFNAVVAANVATTDADRYASLAAAYAADAAVAWAEWSATTDPTLRANAENKAGYRTQSAAYSATRAVSTLDLPTLAQQAVA